MTLKELGQQPRLYRGLNDERLPVIPHTCPIHPQVKEWKLDSETGVYVCPEPHERTGITIGRTDIGMENGKRVSFKRRG